MNTRKTGKIGELYATLYLLLHGYGIAARNYTVKGGEIDIVAYNRSYVVFAEVKTRKKNSMVNSAEAVDYSKQQHIIKAAYSFLQHKKKYTKLQPRFDVICVEKNKAFYHVTEHITDAFGV